MYNTNNCPTHKEFVHTRCGVTWDLLIKNIDNRHYFICTNTFTINGYGEHLIDNTQ